MTEDRTANEPGPSRGRRLLARLREIQWPAVAVAAGVALLLGYIGFTDYFEGAGEQHSFWDVLYRDLQLFTLESGSVSGPTPWQLNVARYLAPAVTTVTAAAAIAVLLSERLRLARLRFLHDHTMVCGLGRKGLMIAESLARRGERVVVVESDEQNDYLDRCRERGVPVLFGDAADPRLLRRARVDRARRVVAVTGDDGVNAEVAVSCRRLVADRGGPPLDCFVHLVDTRLCQLLYEQELRLAGRDGLRLEFFDLHHRSARALLHEFPFFVAGGHTEGLAESPPVSRPHVLVVGCGRTGQDLIVQAARQWWREHRGSGERFWVTIVDWHALARLDGLRLRYPRLGDACEVTPVELDVTSSEFERAVFLGGGDGVPAVTAAYICLDDDSRSLSAGLALLPRTRAAGIPVVMRMMEEVGLATLATGGEDGGTELRAFGVLGYVCAPERLFAGMHETLARAIHEDFVAGRLQAGESSASNPALVDWDELPPGLRESNLDQAAHIFEKLREIDCDLAPLTDWTAESFSFTPEQVEKLAEMEHVRFVKERRDAGWTYQPGPKDIAGKSSPYLRPWDDLRDDEKEFDRRAVRDLPLILADVGLQIVRRDGEGGA